MNRLLALLAAILAALLLPAASASAGYAPAGFAGISPQGATTEKDVELMQQAGISSMRLPMNWHAIQEGDRTLHEPDFDGFDHMVKIAAERGIRVFPFISGSPAWVTPDRALLPVFNPWQRWAWKTFLRDAAHRYGPDGSFWEENPDLPFLPIRRWEIWNEQNIITFGLPILPERFATLIRISGRVLHSIDPGSKVIVGGFFGRPLQIPPNMMPGEYLSRLYRARRVKKFFDGVALHPYVARASAMRAQIVNLRRIMRIHNDAATPLYVTELGWGSDSDESRWERGLLGQAEELDRAFAMLVNNRYRWRIGGLWWFSWSDEEGSCQFCDSAGLLTNSREAKPAWYRFNEWTGGDPGTVPEATFED